MSNLTSFPRQDAYETFLTAEISSAALAMTVATAPSFSLAGGQTLYATIDPGLSTQETVVITAISSATFTITRAAALFEGASSTAYAHAGGATVIISDNWNYFDDIKDAVNSKVDNTGDTMSGKLQFSGTTHAGLQLISLTTTERLALTPVNGDIVYDETLGLVYQYIGGAWAAVDSGTVTPNGSTTVAGKYEEATVAEQGTATATGGTGARLVMANANVVKASSGAGDENKVAILDADGKFADGFQNITEANATTLTDGSEGGGLHYHKMAISQGTRDITVASGAVTYAHGLGRAPNGIDIVGMCDASNVVAGTNPSVSNGFSDGTANMCTFNAGDVAGVAANDASNCISIKTFEVTTLDTRHQTAVATFDATNVTLTWTLAETGTPSQTGLIYFTIKAY